MRLSIPLALLFALGLLVLPSAAEASPSVSCDGCALLASDRPVRRVDDSARLLELENRVDELNREIRGINTNWPGGYIALAYVGYVVAPMGIIGGSSFLIYGLLLSSVEMTRSLGIALAAIGAGGLVLGLAGVGAIVFAVIRGTAVANEAKARRDVLVDERQGLERELDRLRGRTAPPGANATFTGLVPVLAF